MLDNKDLVQNTITKICSYYSENENVSGILKVERIDESGIDNIKIVIIHSNSKFIPNYFGFNNGLDNKYICKDVKVLIESRDSIEFGACARYLFEEGEPTAWGFLIKGEIIYDKTGKYEKLQKEIKKDVTLKRVRSPKSLIPVTRVS